MPIQKIKDPQTGEIREEYVLPTAAPTAAPAKPTAKPAAPAKPAAGPTYGIEDIGGIIKDLTQGPSALLQATPGSVSAAAQELVKTGDLGKAFQKGQTTYIKDLEKPGRGAARTIYSAGRNIVQETSDLLTADIPAKLNIPGAKPTTAQRPDAPLFGFLPPLAKPKSSGVAEDLVTGLVQIAIPWAGVSRGVGFAGAALSKLPGAARVGQAATTTAQAVAASKVGQVAARIPGAVPVGKAIAENVATKAAATGAIIDFAAFDQHTGRLTDLIAQTTKGTPLENIAIDYLKSDPKDVGLDGRLKNVLEGALFGTALESTFRLFRAARAANRYKTDPTPVKAQQVQQANEKLETAIDQLRQTTEQQISPRPPVAAPEPVEPRTAVQPMGNVAAAAIEPPTAPRPQPTSVGPEPTAPEAAPVSLSERLAKEALTQGREPAPVETPKLIATPVPASATKEMPDTRGQGRFFHGAAAEFELQPGGEYGGSGMNIYGNGFYATEDLKIAGQYQKKNSKAEPVISMYGASDELNRAGVKTAEINGLLGRGRAPIPSPERLQEIASKLRQQAGESPRSNITERMLALADTLDNYKPVDVVGQRVIYEINEKKPIKFYDLDAPVDNKVLQELERIASRSDLVADSLGILDPGTYVSGVTPNVSLAQIMDEIRNTSSSLRVPFYEVQDIFEELIDTLKADGYGGFTHEGGRLAGGGKRLHQVRIYWDPAENINTQKVDLAEQLVDRVLAAVAAPETAVQPMGNVAAAAIEPPSPLAAEIKAATRKFGPDDGGRIEGAAQAYQKYFNQGKRQADEITEQQALDAVRAANVSFDPDRVKSLDMDKVRNDIFMGRFTPEVKAAQDAYRSIYDPSFGPLRSRGPELPELPKKPGLTREEIEARIEEIDKLIADIESDKLNMQVDEPRTRALVAELTKDIRTVAGDEVAIRFNNAFMETKGGDVAWGYKPGETMKVGGEYDPIKDIIEINNVELISADVQRPELLRLLVDNLEKTAYHEAFHRVQFNFLKPEEIKVFNQYLAEIKLDFGSMADREANALASRPDLLPIEKAAVAFQIYAWARKNNLDPRKALLGYTREELGKKGIVSALESAALAVMDTLYDFVERVGNAFNDRGFISIKSIFEDAYSGKLAKRGELGSVVDEAGKAVPSELDRLDLLQAQAMEYGETRRGQLGLPVLRSQAGPPPPPDETYTKRFVDQIIENKNKIEAGEITLDDLLVNNVQKFESPSGQTSYVPSPPVNAVQAYRAFSDIFTRPEATGIPVISLETIARETDAWLAKNNYNATAVIEGLQKLSGPLANYEDNLIKLRAGQLYVDDANLKAGIAANKFLNAAADSTADMNQLTADLLTAATYQKAANIALESVTRPIGQLLYSLQGPRPEIGSIEFTQGLPSVKNVGEELEEALDAQAQIPVEESIGKPISPELEEAIVTGEYGPKELEELDQLARSMAQSAVTPGFAKGFWKQVNESAALTTRGLIIYRAAQLLSSGLTLWSNTIGGGIRLLQLPVAQALGAGLSGSVPRASQSLMIYGQYVSNLQNAFRLGTESFKAGRGLYDLDETTMDFLDKMVKEDAQLPLDPNTVEGKGEWDLNTMPWVDIQDKSVWAMAQKKIWQGLNLSTRTQVSLDTFFKVLAGQSFEYVRNLQPGLDRAVGQGMDAGSKEAWDFAQEYAQAAVDRATRDVAINGRTILDAVMTSPQAQTAMRYATFTDDIWAQMETRTPTRAQELAAAQGLEGQAATEYINNYLNTTEEIPFFSRTFSMMPAVWQKLIEFSPLFSIIQPFNRTPGDIVKSVARMAPVAPLVDTFWRDINSADAFTRDRAKGDIAIGMAAVSLGTIAMTQGRVEFTGGGPQEPSAKQKWRESGKVPYSFRVRTGEDENGQPIFSPWVSMRAFEPLSSLFGGMADYQEVANKLPTEARERLGSAYTMDLLIAVAGGQLSKSYYQGFAELYEAFTGTGELDQGPNVRSPIERYISRIITSMVPFSSALRAGRRIEDPTVRVVPPSPVEGGLTGIPMRLFEETLNEIRNGIPGWSESLPPRINWITGQPLLLSGIMGDEFLPPDQPYLSTLAQFAPWSPLQVAPKVDPVMAEMTRLSGRGANFRGPTNTDFGKEFRLTPQQFADYSMAAANVRDEYGRNIYMALEQLINSPFYQSLPEGEISTTVPSRRAAAIDREVSIFKALGKTVYLNSRPDLQQELGVIEGRTKQVQYELKYGQPAGLPQFTEALR